MRYYRDGVLEQGLRISPSPYPTTLLIGIYHVVWYQVTGYRKGEREKDDSLCYDAEIVKHSSDETNFISILKAVPDSTGVPKRKQEVDEKQPCRLIYQFGGHDLSYSLTFSNASPTYLKRLPHSRTVWGPEAEIYFGIVHNDQGFPFLKFESTYTNPDDNSYSILESVAKKTDLKGLYSKNLTKNEKLRLGFPIPEDNPTRIKPETDDSPKETLRVLNEYTLATANQFEKVEILREEIDDQLRSTRKVLQKAVSLSFDGPEDSDSEDQQSADRPPKRKRIEGGSA